MNTTNREFIIYCVWQSVQCHRNRSNLRYGHRNESALELETVGIVAHSITIWRTAHDSFRLCVFRAQIMFTYVWTSYDV